MNYFMIFCWKCQILQKSKQSNKSNQTGVFLEYSDVQLNDIRFLVIQSYEFFDLLKVKREQIQFRSIQHMFTTIMQIQQPSSPLIIGYYPFRARAQLCRLLCEYLHTPYIDKFLNPIQWNDFKKTQAKDWIVKGLPFISDGDFVVTGQTSCSSYIIQKSGRLDLFGCSQQDNIRINSLGSRKDLMGLALGLACKVKAKHNVQKKKQLKHYWGLKIQPILQKHQKEAKKDDWYLGYITLMDFTIYLAMNQLNQTFPDDMIKFQKLNALTLKVLNIPEIYSYENSLRALKCYCPVEYFNHYKEEMHKNGANNNVCPNPVKQMVFQ